MWSTVEYQGKAPVRISFANSGDANYYLELCKRGQVISGTIDLYSYAKLSDRNHGKMIIINSKEKNKTMFYDSFDDIVPDNDRGLAIAQAIAKIYGPTGMDINTWSDYPLESGLGGSAAHTTALLKAFRQWSGQSLDPQELVDEAYHIERNELGLIGGYQDQMSAAYTGFNLYTFHRSQPRQVQRLEVDKKELERHLVLIYVPRTMPSKNMHIEQRRNRERDIHVIGEKQKIVDELHYNLNNRNYFMLGPIMEKDWELKKQIIGTEQRLEDIHQFMRDNGSTGGRWLGSGHGGAGIFYTDDKKKLLKAVKKQGIRTLDFKFT